MGEKGKDLLLQTKEKIKDVWQKLVLALRRPDARKRQPDIVLQRVDQPGQLSTRRQAKKRIRPIRRRSRQRVYRLAGYTTVSKINSRRKSEKRQRVLRQLLLLLVVILAVILLFRLYNPIKDLTEWYRIIGIKEIKALSSSKSEATTGQTGQASTKTGQTAKTLPQATGD